MKSFESVKESNLFLSFEFVQHVSCDVFFDDSICGQTILLFPTALNRSDSHPLFKKQTMNKALLCIVVMSMATLFPSLTVRADIVTLTKVGATNVFDILHNGSNIGTVTLSGSMHSNGGTVRAATGTSGSDSISWGAESGVATFDFNLNSGFVVETAEFGTADGLGNIGEANSGQRPVGYAANFDGMVSDTLAANTFTLSNTVANGGTVLTTTPIAYSAGQFVVNDSFVPIGSVDEYLIESGFIGNTNDITFTYGLSNGGGDTDAARLSFTVTAAVPEPTSATLFGLGGLAILARRKRA